MDTDKEQNKENNIINRPIEPLVEQQQSQSSKDEKNQLKTNINLLMEGNSILNRSSMITYSKIVCCLCGASIEANPRGICLACDQKNIDITTGIPRNLILDYCKLCDRYHRPPWMRCQLESSDMMTLCLSKIKHAIKAKIIDSSFIYTEPHSKQIKIKLTIQKELSNVLVSTNLILDYRVNWIQCPDCKKTFTPHTWNASVQIRQRVKSKLTFLYLEQLVLKHKMHVNALNIKEMPEGVDFYFISKNPAIQFTEFINGYFPCKIKRTNQVISTNERDGISTKKLTYMIEIASICKDELIILNDKQSKIFGGIGPIVLCTKMSSKIALIDPLTFKCTEIDSHTYWKYEFKSYIDRAYLKEFLVMNCEEEIDYKKYSHHHQLQQQQGNQHGDNEEEVINANELSSSIQSHDISKSTNYCQNASQSLIIATNEKHIKIIKCIRNFPSDNTDIIEVKTHLDNNIQPGDIILGYDMNYIIFNNICASQIKGKENNIPDVILVKKKAVGNENDKDKKVKIKRLDIEKENEGKKGKKKNKGDDDNDEYEEFIRDIKENKEMMENINFEEENNTKEDITDERKDNDKESIKESVKDTKDKDKEKGNDDGENENEDDLIETKKNTKGNKKGKGKMKHKHKK